MGIDLLLIIGPHAHGQRHPVVLYLGCGHVKVGVNGGMAKQLGWANAEDVFPNKGKEPSLINSAALS